VHIGVDEVVQGRRVRQSQGSGWVFDQQGHIVTNAHVVRGAQRISLQFQDGRTVDADMIGYDTATDVAVIQAKTTEGLFPVRRAVGDTLRQGDRVFAFGSPFGFKFSMSEGIVSGLGRDPRSVIGQSGYTNFIQTDAAVNPGNSGGPLVDARGLLVGMNVAIATGARSSSGNEGQSAGISFHIPLSTIESVAEQLIAGQPLARGFMGINLPMVARNGDPEAHERLNRSMLDRLGYRGQGVVIVDVEPDGPAANAGLRANDIIVKVGDQRATSIAVARALIANHAPNATLNLEIWRNGESTAVPVVLGVRPPSDTDVKGVLEATARFGMGQVVESNGDLIISQIGRGSAAFRSGLRPGMSVSAVEGKPVATEFDFYLALTAAGLAQGRSVDITVAAGTEPAKVVTIDPNE